MGAFGLVCSAKDSRTNMSVAIKKLTKPLSSAVLAKRAYRELRLLRQLRHDNVIQMLDCFLSPSQDLYIVAELLGADLHQLRHAQNKQLEERYIKYFVYQILVRSLSILRLLE